MNGLFAWVTTYNVVCGFFEVTFACGCRARLYSLKERDACAPWYCAMHDALTP